MNRSNTGRMETTSTALSRRTMSTRILTAGLTVPAIGAFGASHVTAQATPDTGADRIAINPGKMFSGAIVANGFVFTSGMLAIDPDTGELTGDDITAQTTLVMANLEATLNAAGSSMDKVVKATCFLANFDDFQGFNEVYSQAFTVEPPARSTVEVAALAMGALVEIDLVAII